MTTGASGPVLVRLAWHCSGTYDKETGTGGSNGATMRFSPESDHGANAGLKGCARLPGTLSRVSGGACNLQASNLVRVADSFVIAKFPWISYSDLWILGRSLWHPGDVGSADTVPTGSLGQGYCGLYSRRPPSRRRQDPGSPFAPSSTAWASTTRRSSLSAALMRWGAAMLTAAASTVHGLSPPQSSLTTTTSFCWMLKWQWKKWNGPKQVSPDGCSASDRVQS